MIGRIRWLGLLLPFAAASAQVAVTRPLGPVVARSTVPLATVTQVMHLTGGGVLVNDAGQRAVIRLDSTLSRSTVVLDSAGGLANSYGPRASALIPFRADTAIFADRTANALLLLAPSSTGVARVMATGTSRLISATNPPIWSVPFGLVSVATLFGPEPPSPPLGSPPTAVRRDDSVYVVAVHPDTRRTDTLGVLFNSTRTIWSADNGARIWRADVYPTADQWTVTPDGSIAILRAWEYRIDWIAPDRSRRAGPRIPYDWKRLDDAAKAAIVDSINAERRTEHARALAQWAIDSANAMNGRPFNPTSSIGGGVAAGVAPPVGVAGGAVGGGAATVPSGPPRIGLGRMGDGASRLRITSANLILEQPLLTLARVEEVSDYLPAVTSSPLGLRADFDDRLWIRVESYPASASPIYDVVDRSGRRVDRVQIPPGRSIVAFGPGGIVYLTAKDGDRAVLERARYR
jgi:hypothetical protein